MALTSRNHARTNALINPIISALRRQISTDTTPTTIDKSVPFTSRTVETSTSELLAFFRTTSLVRRAEIPANSLYSHYGMGTAEWRATQTRSPAHYKMGGYGPGLKVAGQHFMGIKPDNLHLASPIMNSRLSMLKSTNAHFSSSAESQNVPLHNDHGTQSGIKHLRPLSPHLSVYKPQSSSMFSIFNRISAAMLTAIVLSFTLVTMKMGYICLSHAYFYQSFFYLSKLIPISIEISALALAYHIFHSGYLLLRKIK